MKPCERLSSPEIAPRATDNGISLPSMVSVTPPSWSTMLCMSKACVSPTSKRPPTVTRTSPLALSV